MCVRKITYLAIVNTFFKKSNTMSVVRFGVSFEKQVLDALDSMLTE